jgi:hypothetical protein
MKTIPIIVSFLILSIYSYSQSITISGYVIEENSGEKLIGVTCFDTTLKQSTTTNAYGYFSYTSNRTPVCLKFSSVGYNGYSQCFELSEEIVIKLKEGIDLASVEIHGSNFIDKEGMNLEIQAIKNIPGLFGETDIMRSLTFLPGIMVPTKIWFCGMRLFFTTLIT